MEEPEVEGRKTDKRKKNYDRETEKVRMGMKTKRKSKNGEQSAVKSTAEKVEKLGKGKV